MIKYSITFEKIRMLSSTYCHMIIRMIYILTILEINDFTEVFIFYNVDGVGTELKALQAHHSQNVREKYYADTFQTLWTINACKQDIFL